MDHTWSAIYTRLVDALLSEFHQKFPNTPITREQAHEIVNQMDRAGGLSDIHSELQIALQRK